MTFVCVCKNCGRTIDNDFNYCPWCGSEKQKSSLKTKVFDELEEKQILGFEKKINELSKTLDELESFFSNLTSL